MLAFKITYIVLTLKSIRTSPTVETIINKYLERFLFDFKSSKMLAS